MPDLSIYHEPSYTDELIDYVQQYGRRMNVKRNVCILHTGGFSGCIYLIRRGAFKDYRGRAHPGTGF